MTAPRPQEDIEDIKQEWLKKIEETLDKLRMEEEARMEIYPHELTVKMLVVPSAFPILERHGYQRAFLLSSTSLSPNVNMYNVQSWYTQRGEPRITILPCAAVSADDSILDMNQHSQKLR